MHQIESFDIRIRLVACLGILFVILAIQPMSIVWATQSSASTNATGFLRAQGRWVVDQSGSLVILRGANFEGYEYGQWDMHTEADYQQMSSWGFNVVRLPIAWNFIEPKPGQYDETLFSQYVDRDIAWAKKYGIYVIIDLHQYGWSPYFTNYDSWHTAGVPSWSVSGYPNTSQGEAQAKADFWNNMGPNGTLPTDTNPSMQDRFMQVWKYVAGRYSQEEAVAGYDILNEPMIYSMNGDVSYNADRLDRLCTETLPAFYNKAVDTVRTVDNNHMIFWEPALVGNKITSPPDRPNMIYSPHYPGYEGMTMNGYDGNTTRLHASLEGWLLASQVWNQPVFVGEWGMRVEGTNAVQYILDLTDLMDEHLLGAAWWAYAKGSFGMYLLDEAGNVRSTLVNNLVRPFISGSSASIYSSHFDRDAGQFRVDLKGVSVVLVRLPSFYLRSFAVQTDIGVSSFSIFQGTLSIWTAEETSQMTVYLNSLSSLVPSRRT